MIEELRISGVGVIDTAQLALSPRFTVITGETGAGKTMILTALRLLLGEKADSNLVRAGHRQIEVDGVFSLPEQLGETLSTLGLDADEELIVSRTVPSQGRSRAAAQGRPVPQRALQEIVGPLITIHGQSDQWKIRRPGVQRELVDLYAGDAHSELVDAYRAAWGEAVRLKNDLDRLYSEHDQRQIEVKYLAEITAAIEELDPTDGEELDLGQQIDRFANVAQLSADVTAAFADLRGTERNQGVEDNLGHAAGVLRQVGELDPVLEQYAERLTQVEAEVSDIASDLRDYLELLEDDPAELARLHQRRADLENLMKGRATTAAELLAWLGEAQERLRELTGEGANPETVAAELDRVKAEVLRLGEKLTASRQQAGRALAKAVNAELGALAMGEADFRVHFEPTDPGPFGLDEVSLDLRGRPDGPYRPLGDGASGGEISRVMLALELAVGQRRLQGTYVFDEVDQGVGGHTATEVGRRLSRLSHSQQVIAVTHLPQVAAYADEHFVLKREGTLTRVDPVAGDDRVEEIMRMLGAETDSVSGRRHAEELLGEKRDKIDQGRKRGGSTGE